jgi:hypothetical protein
MRNKNTTPNTETTTMTKTTKTNDLSMVETEVIENLLETICDEDDQDTMKEVVQEWFLTFEGGLDLDEDEVMDDFRIYVETTRGDVTWM